MANNARISLRVLRKEAPWCNWRPERYGMGWRYIGARDDERVVVYAAACLCGPGEDDYATVWMVDDGRVSQSYAMWWMREYDRERSRRC